MPLTKREPKENILLFLKGLAMGIADLIPGVSGGTIAFITGIYEEFLNGIKSCNHEALTLLFKRQFKSLWEHINGSFLIVLFSGIGLSIVSFSKLIKFLLSTYPIHIWSFFFGLIIISALVVFQHIKEKNITVGIAGILGAIVAYLVTSATPSSTPDNLIFTFFSGMIAITAMILPGISGSFILIILGKYETILAAINNLQIITIGTFGAGCLLGILTFSRVISWLLKKYHDITVAVLGGFMFGSLNKIWPWKEVISTRINSKGVEVPLLERNISPQNYAEIAGEPFLVQAVIFFILGFSVILIMEQVAKKLNTKD